MHAAVVSWLRRNERSLPRLERESIRMRAGRRMVIEGFMLSALLCGCGGGAMPVSVPPTQTAAAAPTITTSSTGNGAQGGAVIASLNSTTSGAIIYFTLDGTTPTTSSQQ